MSGEGAAQAQRSRQQPAQSQPAQSQPVQAPASEPRTTAQAEPAAPSAEPAPQTEPSAAPRLVDPRQQGPLPIRVVPSPKSEEELVAERQDREQRSSLQTNLQIFAVLIVVVGFFQLIAFTALGIYLWRALAAMRRPVELAERNLTIAQRAFVGVGSLDWKVAGGSIRITPTMENNGVTPARTVRISTNWKAWHGDLPPDFAYSYSRPPDRLSLGARSKAEIASVLIPMRDIEAAIEERLHLYFWGRATYEEIFDGAEPHYVEFCYRLDATGAAPGNIALAFTPYGRHNRTDEDSRRPAAPEQQRQAGR